MNQIMFKVREASHRLLLLTCFVKKMSAVSAVNNGMITTRLRPLKLQASQFQAPHKEITKFL